VLSLGGVPVRVSALPTGTVTIKSCHHHGCLPESAPYLARFAAIVADATWATPMPIWTYLIEHPEGAILVDAGATPRYRDAAAWAFDPVSRRIIQSFIGLDVREDETVPARLRAMGLHPAAVRSVVLTHQHVDHTGAVPDFPGAVIWTAAAEDAAAGEIGASHGLWRGAGTLIRYVDQEGASGSTELGPSVALTSDGRIQAVATPGHTPGSLSVRILGDEGDIWMIGDIAFTVAGLAAEAPLAGIHTEPPAIRRLHAFFRAQPGTRIFPSHDPDVPTRLAALGRPPAAPPIGE
jgi:glyoxylase-like metal-dependent hydrolase (beta-lactamase superfamily II)